MPACPVPAKRPHYHEALPGQVDLEEYLAAIPASDAGNAAGGNGGPALEEDGYRTLERIGEVAFDGLWHGKLAAALGQDPRAFRRWRDGEGRPPERTVAWAREWARATALRLLAAAGEDDLSEAVARRQSDLKRAAAERGRDAMRQSLAGAAAQAPEQG